MVDPGAFQKLEFIPQRSPGKRKKPAMNSSIQLKTPTRSKRNSIGGVVLVALLLVCMGLLPRARAVSPPPDGGYANFNTAEGTNALLHPLYSQRHLQHGPWRTSAPLNEHRPAAPTRPRVLMRSISTQLASYNTASGFEALFRNTTGYLQHGLMVTQCALKQHDRPRTRPPVLVRSKATPSAKFNTATGVNALLHNTTGNRQHGHRC